MKNPKVKDLIAELEKLNPEAVVCRLDGDNNEWFYSSVEMIRELGKTKYIDDSGDNMEGEAVMIY